MRRSLHLFLAAAAMLSAGSVRAVESDPLPVPKQNARANAVRLYNDGVALLLERNFAGAQRKFEEALVRGESTIVHISDREIRKQMVGNKKRGAGE